MAHGNGSQAGVAEADEQSSGIKKNEFDPRLARAIWNPESVSQQNDSSWYFICDNKENGTRFTVEVMPWVHGGWYVEIDIETLEAAALQRGEVRTDDHLAHFRFPEIQEFEFNQKKGYVQFNRDHAEGEDEKYIRLFASGYLFVYV